MRVFGLFLMLALGQPLSAQSISAPQNPTDLAQCTALHQSYVAKHKLMLQNLQSCYNANDPGPLVGQGCATTFHAECLSQRQALCASYDEHNNAHSNCRRAVMQHSAKVRAEAEARRRIANGEDDGFSNRNANSDSPSAQLYRGVRDTLKAPAVAMNNASEAIMNELRTSPLRRGAAVAGAYNAARGQLGRPVDRLSAMLTGIALQGVTKIGGDALADFDRVMADVDGYSASNPLPTAQDLSLPNSYNVWNGYAQDDDSRNGTRLNDAFASDRDVEDLIAKALEYASAGELDLDEIDTLEELDAAVKQLNAQGVAANGQSGSGGGPIDGTRFANDIREEKARLEGGGGQQGVQSANNNGSGIAVQGSGSGTGCSDSALDNEVKRAQATMGAQPSGVGAAANWTLRVMRISRDKVIEQNARCPRDLSYAVSYYNNEIKKLEDWMRSAGVQIR